MSRSGYAAQSLVAIAVLLWVGLAGGAEPSTLEELAVAIERVRTGLDGERVVVGHISRKLGLSVEVLRAQQAQNRLSWGELFIANLLAQETKLAVDKVVAEFQDRRGVGGHRTPAPSKLGSVDNCCTPVPPGDGAASGGPSTAAHQRITVQSGDDCPYNGPTHRKGFGSTVLG
jgi:hypothetical protein